MRTHIKTLISRLDAPVSEKLTAILNVFSEKALVELFEDKLNVAADFSPIWKEPSHKLLKVLVLAISHKRHASNVGRDVFSEIEDINFIIGLTQCDEADTVKLKSAAQDYIASLPNKAGTHASHHGFVFQLISKSLRLIMEDLEEATANEHIHAPVKAGDVITEGPGFEVVAGPNHNNYVRYPQGDTAVIVMHDIRENHFLMVERYNPIRGLHVLEFPRIKSSSPAARQGACNAELRDLTGLHFRNLEKLGCLLPDAHILDGRCEVYYGNFDLEENHTPTSKEVRSLKRITESGLYLAAYEGRVECSLTLAAISVWHAFEVVRKKRENNSKRIRNRVAEDDDED